MAGEVTSIREKYRTWREALETAGTGEPTIEDAFFEGFIQGMEWLG